MLVLLLMAIIYFIFWVYNRSRQIPPQLAMLEYFFLTLFFALQFHLSYASINTLYNYVMLTALDAFNTPFAIFMLLLTFLVVPVVWIVSSEQVISAETLQPKVFVKNDIDENTD